jgi:hypothetical protein
VVSELDPYVALADEAVHRAAVASRREERDRRDRASELATWLGALRDLAERDVEVSVGCAAGRGHRGRLVAVGPDHLGLRLPTGALVLVALDTVRSVRPEPGHRGGAAMGDREPPADRTLAEVLQDLADRDGTAAIALRDVADPLQGTVLGLGEDVMTLRLDTAQRETVLVPLCAIAELLVAP